MQDSLLMLELETTNMSETSKFGFNKKPWPTKCSQGVNINYLLTCNPPQIGKPNSQSWHCLSLKEIVREHQRDQYQSLAMANEHAHG